MTEPDPHQKDPTYPSHSHPHLHPTHTPVLSGSFDGIDTPGETTTPSSGPSTAPPLTTLVPIPTKVPHKPSLRIQEIYPYPDNNGAPTGPSRAHISTNTGIHKDTLHSRLPHTSRTTTPSRVRGHRPTGPQPPTRLDPQRPEKCRPPLSPSASSDGSPTPSRLPPKVWSTILRNVLLGSRKSHKESSFDPTSAPRVCGKTHDGPPQSVRTKVRGGTWWTFSRPLSGEGGYCLLS